MLRIDVTQLDVIHIDVVISSDHDLCNVEIMETEVLVRKERSNLWAAIPFGHQFRNLTSRLVTL